MVKALRVVVFQSSINYCCLTVLWHNNRLWQKLKQLLREKKKFFCWQINNI